MDAIKHVRKYHLNLVSEQCNEYEKVQSKNNEIMIDLTGKEKNDTNEIAMVESKIENVEISHVDPLKNITDIADEEIEDWETFIEENYKTLQTNEQSELSQKIKSVCQLKDLSNKNHYEEIDCDNDKSDRSSENDIELLEQFNCTLCNDKYNTAEGVDDHISNFHQIASKSFRKSLVLQSKNY